MKSTWSRNSTRFFSLLVGAAIAAVVGMSSRQSSADAEEFSTTSGLAQLFAATGVVVPRPDLSSCPFVARKFALSTYMNEVTADAAKIQAALDDASKFYDACRLLTGSFRNACCAQVKKASIEKCQAKIAAQEAADTACAPRPINCRALRPAKCLLERAIERQRVKCCSSLDAQGLNFLSNYCAVAETALASACLVPDIGTPAPTP